MEEVAFYPGSCGEIIQGKVNGQDMLISCPVNLFTKVRVYESKGSRMAERYSKSEKMVKNLLTKWGYCEYIEDLNVDISSNIPKGKGFASSTADLCGIYRCLTKLFNKHYSISELMEECISIEPTDSIIFNEMTLFDYREGKCFKNIGDYFEMHLLVFEGRKIVDTVKFNRSKIPPLKDITSLLDGIEGAVRRRDIKAVAQFSTISILENQERLRYEAIPEVLRIKERTGGLGILGGHSGDVLAIIYGDEEGLKRGFKYRNSIKGYSCYPLKTLRSVECEGIDDYCAI